MRYEWNSKRARGLYVERAEDGSIETNAGPDDFDAHEEVLRLAERVRELEGAQRWYIDQHETDGARIAALEAENRDLKEMFRDRMRRFGEGS